MPDKTYCYPNSDVLINKLNIRNQAELLADNIKQISDKASSAAKSAVNQLMTLRKLGNWLLHS